jgi:hypothetical protein
MNGFAIAGRVTALSVALLGMACAASSEPPVTTENTDSGVPTDTANVAVDTGAPSEDTAPVSAPATNVKDSAACKTWCKKLWDSCSRECDPLKDCEVKIGQCAKSTEAYLSCQVDTGSWSCGSSGYSIVASCKRDPSVCPAGSIRMGETPDAGIDTGKKDAYSVPTMCSEARAGKGCCGWGTSPYDQIAYTCASGKIVAEKCGPTGCVVGSDGYAKCGDGSEYPATPNCF